MPLRSLGDDIFPLYNNFSVRRKPPLVVRLQRLPQLHHHLVQHLERPASRQLQRAVHMPRHLLDLRHQLHHFVSILLNPINHGLLVLMHPSIILQLRLHIPTLILHLPCQINNLIRLLILWLRLVPHTR